MTNQNNGDEIKIQGEVIDGDRCRFTVNQTVFPAGGSMQINDRELARDNPLADKLFELQEVTAVLLAGNTVTISKKGTDEWPVIGKKIGEVIRTFLRSQGAELSTPAAVAQGAGTPAEKDLRAKVQKVLDTQINPAVGGHGGVVDLLDVKESTVYIRMGGGCQGCGMAAVTLKNGIEKAIRENVPEVGDILDTTDHASGRNPYYAPTSK
ncbi:MAG TPA: NifU family protein [Nitrospiria bacterium]|nr:NifU family protein [Nitrospiria bacterium]